MGVAPHFRNMAKVLVCMENEDVFQKGISFLLPLKKLSANSPPLSLIWIEPGTFMMGSSGEKCEYRHGYEEPFQGTISDGFWLGKYPITQDQWQAVMKSNPSQYQPCPNCPVENLNREEAISFCNQLNRLFSDQLPLGYRFGLPTEMQWEYACRSGTQTKYYHGDDALTLSQVAWYDENSSGHPHPVGEKAPNAWGLYDMLGNVWEWCDDFASPYPAEPTADWVGSMNKSTGIFRGGDCNSSADSDMLLCSTRGYSLIDIKMPCLGFRLSLRVV